ncbi:MAG: nucleic-acid-binding protein [Erythrobacter sp. RIFCSPHIGHO2_12_FULL_63_10]|nr:MAG: nucleic-acid-binding protein [Erythrobacter sp. RIFCSPHIGHO2_12_FULL_63_10]
MRTPTNERLTPDIVEAAGARKVSEPQRRCILSGEHATRHSLVRLAISPANSDGVSHVLPDAGAKAPGRGAWIGVTRAELETAIAKGRMKAALARAFKGEALVLPGDLPELIERALKKALTPRLWLEMRAGTLVLGSDRIAEQARMGRIALLLHASDASDDGRSKLDQAWRVGREIEGSGERGMVLPLDRMALSVALGRDNVVHVAVGNASAADRIANAIGRLQHYLAGAKPD